MKEPLVLYSTNTWLAYAITERFYDGVHYAWCSPVYNGSTAAPHVNIPPSSSPAEIYRQLFREVDRGEQHSKAIENNRAGIEKGAEVKLKAGVITEETYEEIARTLERAEVRDFRPVLYVIPYDRVRGIVLDVPVHQRAHPLSVEYRVERLPNDCFDMLELGV
jgi:hypothetical protein